MKKLFFGISAILLIALANLSSLTDWESLSIAMMVYFFLEFLEDLGKRIVVLDIIILMGCFTMLVMPVIFYHVYTKANPLARIWYRYMLVSSDDYFSFVVPGMLLLILGLRLPLTRLKYRDKPQQYMINVREQLEKKPNLGLILIGIGAVGGFVNPFVPSAIGQVFFLLGHLTYVGVFYVIYSPNKRKRLTIALVITLMLAQSIISGMFGEMVFILILSAILLVLGTNIKFQTKFLLAIFGMFFIILIQSIKGDYRLYSWKQGGGADPAYFVELVVERIADPSNVLDDRKMFTAATRMNQGWLVATTMYKVPDKHPFANGETIWQSVLASFVPRFAWPDKPESGGKANLWRFWGVKLKGYSTNIGPVGEAYGNFGVLGGAIYMFFYGLFFNLILSRILKLSETRPTLILWLPYLFLYTVNVETDLVTTMNSIVKGVFFVWVMYKGFKSLFNIEL
jgi:hypothetical protein